MKSPATPEEIWTRLVRTARAGRPAVSEEETSPYGFATQVVARWQAVREAEQRLALWQRVSWRVACATLLASGWLAISSGGKPTPTGLLEPPPLPWLSLGTKVPS